MHRCAIYARFSTDRQSENSAEDQVRECRRYADRQGWNVVEVYTDLAISGANNRRPGMTAMLADIAANRFDILLAEDQDRLARDQEDIAAIFKRVTFDGRGRIFTISAGELNELHIGLKGTMDALELKKMADKIRRGQRGSVARGSIPGGLCYGYDVVRELDERGEPVLGRRRINPEQAAVVTRIMEEFAAGRGALSIARDLNAEGIPSPRGREWKAPAIVGNKARKLGILHNPIYVGRFAYNRVRMVRDPETRNRLSRPNAEEDLVYADMPDLRIVSDELWSAVQEAREARAAVPLVHRKRPKHLLSGLVSCGVCGGSFAMISNGRMGCSSYRNGGACKNSMRVAAAELQRRVLMGIEQQLLSPEAISLMVREYHEERERRLKEGARLERSLRRHLNAAEAAVDRLVAAIADGGAGFAEVRRALSDKVAERDRLKSELAELDDTTIIDLHPRIADAYRERISALLAGLHAGEITQHSSAGRIRDLVDVIYVEPGKGEEPMIVVKGSLESAIALAQGTQSRRRGSASVRMMVAEEGLEPPTPGL